ncbi:cytochrome P450 [Mycobacterium shigaense]|uniref:Biotin biosynthesis cytochrome P450 n=1 Tax=Mycobacterium shigaense TaxID=722731 RepID=A0A1Z4EDC9_9MYCO|nr:cytochrome P450 [Mycobacterium shigaense]MEA1124462.1 cytochrome P450 [Mycobacterium shigaense]PRI16835.1 cytochrome [Mycobacterium shigaense]BAX90981.1 biotin biosynthesis cytochrome P450 [Mycobacterium shigaense]
MTPEEAFDAAMRFEHRANPYPFFDELRKTPVVRVSGGIYAVTGYEELMALAHDPRVSSDLRKSRPPAGPGRRFTDESPAEIAPEIAGAYGKEPSFIAQDPPEHDRARRVCMHFFGPPDSPDLIPGQEPLCQQIANEMLDKARGKTRIDVVDEFAYPLPVNVICRIMGVPVEDEPQFHAWLADITAGVFDLGPDIHTEEGQARRAKGEAADAELNAYIAGLAEKAVKSPGNGMISQLVHYDGPDGRMSPSAIVNNTILLFFAGHDSTVNLISHCVLTALRNPWSIELLRSRPELIPGAVEEVLRLQSSVQFFPTRSALADIDIAGTTIPKGAPIYLIYAAANRDPRRFADPDTFDPQRPDNEHVGWGRGIHVCFGGPLARLEVNTAFEAFLRRVKNPRLVADPPPYRISQVFRGPLHLPVDYDEILP